MILIDTHIWVWLANEDERLKPPFRKALKEAVLEAPLMVSDISLWEIQTAAAGGMTLPLPLADWFRQSTRSPMIELKRITPQVVLEIDRLNPFHKDPANRIITATARVSDVPLATHDSDIIQSGAVLIWRP